MTHKFDPKKLAKLDSPERRKLLPPELVVNKIEASANEVWADIGCGIGYITIPLAQTLNQEGKVYGLDISPELLEVARQRTCGVENGADLPIEYLLAQEHQLALPDNCCDGVLMVNVWHELDERDSYVQEIKRVLKPKGKLCIVDWQKREMPMGPPVAHRVDVEAVKVQLSQQGFDQQTSENLGEGHYLVIGTMVS